jgi:selenophosphate synthase
VVVGLDSPDDAAVVAMPPGTLAVHTVDYFRSFVSDPFIFGKIAAVHALGDCWGMGAEPISALAIAQVRVCVIHSFVHSFIQSCIRSFIHSFIHSLTH